jgi:hypothetical protein
MQTRQPKQPFAYALRETEDGWSWKVLDRDGVRVAVGVAQDRATAQQWIASVYRGEGAPPAAELAATPPPAAPMAAGPRRGATRRRSA